MLKLDPNIPRADDFYEALIEAHRGLTREESALVNAKLILLLANQIGDYDILTQAIAKARAGVTSSGEDSTQSVVA